MGAVASEINASMFFALGDNFYHSANSHCKQSGICPDNADGVDGAQRFKTTFEDVYTAPSLRRIPFCALHCRVLPAVRVCRWPQPVSRLRCLPLAVCLGLTSSAAADAIAGNHDHGGNVSAQIAYTANRQNLRLNGTAAERGLSQLPPTRWTFPDYWFGVTQHIEVQGKPLELEVRSHNPRRSNDNRRLTGRDLGGQFLLFDTVIMAGQADVYASDGALSHELSLSELPGPADPALAAKQLSWLEGRMNSSTADYLWVGGHYPVWAIGDDSPTGIEKPLRPLLNRWEAHYFNGHVRRPSKMNP